MIRPCLLVTTPESHQYVYELDADSLRVGRAPDCAINLGGNAVSRHHAEIRIPSPTSENVIATIRDLGSTNGTFINGREVATKAVPIHPDDTIFIGGHTLRLLLNYADIDPADLISPPSSSSSAAGVTQIMATPANTKTLIPDTPKTEQADFASEILRVVVHAPEWQLSVEETGTIRSHTLERRVYTIGRGSDNDIVLADPTTSSKHARLDWQDGALYAHDAGSTNGCYINGMQVTEATRLNDGDVMRVGGAYLHFSADKLNTAAEIQRRPAILIPGFAGTELWVERTQVWPNLGRLLTSNEEDLIEEWTGELSLGQLVREPAIMPGLAKSDSFRSLIRFLEEDLGYQPGVNYLEYPYDWRADLFESATRLRQSLAEWRSSRTQPTQKVTIIAHSMGGIVARLACAHQDVRDAVDRLILLGTPHMGTAVALMVAMEGSRLLPLGLGARKIRRLALSLPSFYQLFPNYPVAHLTTDASFLPYSEEDGWLPRAARPYMDRARQIRQSLDQQHLKIPTTSIFGYDQKTIQSMRVSRQSNSLTIEAIEYANCGDGIVTESSAVLPNSEVHPVNQHHGVLYSDPDVLRRLRYELQERP